MLVYVKFRLQRQLRRFRRDIRLWRIYITNYFERHIWGKWRQLGTIRRFILVWWSIMVVSFIGLALQIGTLKQAYLKAGPQDGGIYSEGLVGTVKSINPILPDSDASSDVSRLIFSSLMRLNADGQIEGDLAQSWQVSADGRTYSFHLQPGAKWQDGAPLTAKDVLFTLKLIQNPDTRSPLASSWQGVSAQAVNDSTINFILPNPFAPFIYSVNFGILPKHLLEGVDPATLRVTAFNQQPVGSGPFKFVSLSPDGKNVALSPNPTYYRGAPLLDQFNFHLYNDQQLLRQAYAKHQVNAIGRVSASELTGYGQATIHAMTMLDEVGLFMRTTTTNLGDKAVRQAIIQSINRTKLASAMKDDVAESVSLPILPGQLGYNAKYSVPQFDPKSAAKTLDAAGWVLGKNAQRRKDNKPLTFKLVTANVGNYPLVAGQIRDNLAKVGITVNLELVDVNQLQQTYIRPRNYDLLLYTVAIGPDPDGYAYWQSSQANDPGLNLSQYSSASADKALEAARLTSDSAIRTARYGNFLSAWTADLPADMLYIPNYLYLTNRNVSGVVARRIGDPTDRFYGVERWTINTRQSLRTS